MFKKQWSHVEMLAVIILTATILVLSCISFVFTKIRKEEEKYTSFLKNENHAYVGVALRNDTLSKDCQENYQRAMTFINTSDSGVIWQYYKTVEASYQGYTVFVFKMQLLYR